MHTIPSTPGRPRAVLALLLSVVALVVGATTLAAPAGATPAAPETPAVAA